MVEGDPMPDDVLCVVLAAFIGGPPEEALHDDVVVGSDLQNEIEGRTQASEYVVEGVDLMEVARIAVEEEPAGHVLLAQPGRDHAIGDVVGHELAARGVRISQAAQFVARAGVGPEDRAR